MKKRFWKFLLAVLAAYALQGAELGNKDKAHVELGLRPQTVIQNFMFERFLARLAVSDYRDNFVVKGIIRNRVAHTKSNGGVVWMYHSQRAIAFGEYICMQRIGTGRN